MTVKPRCTVATFALALALTVAVAAPASIVSAHDAETITSTEAASRMQAKCIVCCIEEHHTVRNALQLDYGQCVEACGSFVAWIVNRLSD